MSARRFMVQAGNGAGMFVRIVSRQSSFVRKSEASKFTKIEAELLVRRFNRTDSNADDDYHVVEIPARKR